MNTATPSRHRPALGMRAARCWLPALLLAAGTTGAGADDLLLAGFFPDTRPRIEGQPTQGSPTQTPTGSGSEQAGPATAQAPPEASGTAAAPDPGDETRDQSMRMHHFTPDLESLMNEFMATGEAIEDRPGGGGPVTFGGPPGKPNWFQTLTVTQEQNPLLEEECREQAMDFSVNSLRQIQGTDSDAEALRAAAEHMRSHQDFIQSGKVSYSAYLKEVADCPAFCAPLVANLMKCHILSVARHPHGIVLFPLGSDQVDERYEEGIIERMARQLDEDPQRKLLLIGRASRIGDLDYNRRLAARRVLAVRDLLMERGVALERIHTLWFGWEPPQISEFVAAEYGIESLHREVGDMAINQSVVMVIH